MYCPDTLKRLNDKAVADHMARNHKCDFCSNTATRSTEIFNPADELRDPPVTGAVSILNLCEDCNNQKIGSGDIFYCRGCGRHFIRLHSWDTLSVILDGEELCQKCAADELQPIPLAELYTAIEEGRTAVFTRINSVPGKEKAWEGEYSSWEDFPGHTSFDSVLRSIKSAFLGESVGTLVYPVIDHTYQFSLSLAVYR